jgi:hypothetical protein
MFLLDIKKIKKNVAVALYKMYFDVTTPLSTLYNHLFIPLTILDQGILLQGRYTRYTAQLHTSTSTSFPSSLNTASQEKCLHLQHSICGVNVQNHIFTFTMLDLDPIVKWVMLQVEYVLKNVCYCDRCHTPMLKDDELYWALLVPSIETLTLTIQNTLETLEPIPPIPPVEQKEEKKESNTCHTCNACSISSAISCPLSDDFFGSEPLASRCAICHESMCNIDNLYADLACGGVLHYIHKTCFLQLKDSKEELKCPTCRVAWKR